MDKVRKPSNSLCNTLSSEPYRIYVLGIAVNPEAKYKILVYISTNLLYEKLHILQNKNVTKYYCPMLVSLMLGN
jgi:hypothetical protein